MIDRVQFCTLLCSLTGSIVIRIDYNTSHMILIISRTIVDVIKTSFWVIGGPFRVKIDVFCESRKSRRTIIQFFVNYAKSKGFRAQRWYKCQYKLAYCGHFEPKNKSLRPSEAEIVIACNRDYAQKKGVAPHGGLQRE